jgi:diaminopimelate epimerase
MNNVSGLRFFKMSGSGNDFVVVDARQDPHEELRTPEVIQRLSARGTGVGADGLVLLAAEPGADFRMIYYNADGSRASMCGNAALCCTRLATELGGGKPRELRFATDSGIVTGRVVDGRPEIDLASVSVVRPDAPVRREGSEERIGYAVAGVPHLTVLVDDLDAADVAGRGRALRFAPEVGAEGANANFVAQDGRGWAMRTYERGVEAETLACGTGTAAAGLALAAHCGVALPLEFQSRGGGVLTVRAVIGDGRAADLWLGGEGRLVFTGEWKN